MNCIPPRRSARKGVSAVELAITLPVMMIVLLGAIDAGQAVNVRNKVDNASRVGARVAARATITSSNDVSTAVATFLAAAFPSTPSSDLTKGTTVSVKDSAGTAVTDLSTIDAGDPVLVEVKLSYDTVRWTQKLGILKNRDFTTVTHMRRE